MSNHAWFYGSKQVNDIQKYKDNQKCLDKQKFVEMYNLLQYIFCHVLFKIYMQTKDLNVVELIN